MSCNASDVNVVSLSLSKYPAAPSGADARRCDARATRCSEGNVGVATWPRPTVRATERPSFDPSTADLRADGFSGTGGRGAHRARDGDARPGREGGAISRLPRV